MVVSVTEIAKPNWPSEVAALAVEQGVDEALPAVFGMTRRIFNSARIRVSAEEDPEIADDRHIVFHVQTPLGVSEAVEAEDRWCRELPDSCPPSLMCTFRLSMEIVS